MKSRRYAARRWAAVLLFGLAATALSAEGNLRDTLFAQADEALGAANAARASVLAPKSYAEAAKYYRSAEDKLERGRGIDSIKADLERAATALREAADATRLANITLASAIQARDDAEAASAATFAADEWRQAEEKFAAAAVRLEDGNVNIARSRADDAKALYRAAELTAIQANYLDETRRLIAEAKALRVERYAPKTMATAETLLGQAEKALGANRYDTDEPRSLARQAKYEVKHAMHLAETLKPVRDRKVTLEDFALANEVAVIRIAGSLDLVAELDNGQEAPTNAILAKIDNLQKDAYVLSERRTQILELESEIQRLENDLGRQSDRLAIQEAQRQRIRQVESMFAQGEAVVFTQGQNVLIRP